MTSFDSASASPSGPLLSQTYGPLFISLVVAAMCVQSLIPSPLLILIHHRLFGITNTQVFTFYRVNARDPVGHKIVVCVKLG